MFYSFFQKKYLNKQNDCFSVLPELVPSVLKNKKPVNYSTIYTPPFKYKEVGDCCLTPYI